MNKSDEGQPDKQSELVLVLAELQVSLYNAAQQVDHCGSHYVTKDGPFIDEAKRVLELIPLVQAALRTPPSAGERTFAPEPNGYAVVIDDEASAVEGIWFVGCYVKRDMAEHVAKRNKARVQPIYFNAPAAPSLEHRLTKSEEAASRPAGCITGAHIYHDALRQARLAVRYTDGTEEDRPATGIEEALFARSATGAIKDDVPLRCEVVDGAIQFTIGAKVLAHATDICPRFYDTENDRGMYRVTDHASFAEDVAHELNREREDGSTILTDVLDKAIAEAIDQGAEGVEENSTVGPTATEKK